MKIFKMKLFLMTLLSFCVVSLAYSKQKPVEADKNPYHINYWITGAICGVGIYANITGMEMILHKPDLTTAELRGINRNVLNGLDKSSLHQDYSKKGMYDDYGDYTLSTMVILPGLLLFDKQIRHDWADLLLMYAEVVTVELNIFEWSPLGPNFQNKLRPLAYYENLTDDQRNSGNNRNSFYSGHVSSIAATTFFAAKIYSDYNPEIGNNKYFLYAAATIPPLLLGYLRVKSLQHFPSDVFVGLGMGALCGILIPELHRFDEKGISLSMFASPESTGITVTWKPDY
jgi:membrane-associated phospholipid phosphatase